MSTDNQLPGNTSRPLQVTIDPAPGTLVIDTGDPFTAAIKVPVIQVPITQLMEEKRRAYAAATPPTATPATPPTATPSTATPNTDTDPPLPNDVPVLQAMIRELLEALKQSNHVCDGLRERLDLLLRKLYGPKAERFNPDQPWLLPEMAPGQETCADSPATDADNEEKTKPTKKTKGHGRKPLPANLPRKRIEHTLAEAERLCPCCGIPCQKFGESVHEQLDYKPASLFVCQHVRFKYACPGCHDHLVVAKAPVAIIEKGVPGPGLLAQITACKYADHLPLHRLERILARHGIDLARSTMCDWMAHVAAMLQPVTDLMAQIVRQSKAIHADATKMPYLDPSIPGKTLSGQMWDYVGDRDHAFNVFDFCPNHTAAGIDTFLRDHHYKGYLNVDAINLYDHLFADGSMIEVGCWAHCRRYFHDAKQSDPTRAHLALARIRQLYTVEAEAKQLIAQQELTATAADALRLQLRQEKSLLDTTALHSWLQTEHSKVLPKSLIGQAIAYALRHWQALSRYLDDGFLAIDNNIAELTLRHIAIGRKNWLFAGSAQGARTAATLFTITSSCHRHRIDVFAYLRDILARLAHDPHPDPQQLRDWLPDRWKPPPAES